MHQSAAWLAAIDKRWVGEPILAANEKQKRRIVVGLGLTGVSCARFLAARGLPFAVMDSRSEPPGIHQFRDEFPSIDIHLGDWNEAILTAADELYVSPGVPLSEPVLQQAASDGARISSDLDLFMAEVAAPVIAITGSNAKSTVTSLVGDMAYCAGLNAGIGGNLGTPMLDLLDEERDCYVLELSSFQLERCAGMEASVASILNISADHIDRHGSMRSYQDAKQVIYRDAGRCVVNRNDAATYPRKPIENLCSFGLDQPAAGDWGVVTVDDHRYIAKGSDAVLSVSALQLVGSHNLLNVVAAFALGDCAGLPVEAMCEAAVAFCGLPHRCELVAEHAGVRYINDSKATNTGATIAALEGLRAEIGGNITLIAGGQGKGADFAVLRETVAATASRVLLIGEAGPALADVFDSVVAVEQCVDLESAVAIALADSKSGDAVLFSPACASFDMFDSFVHRGDVFRDLVVTAIGAEPKSFGAANDDGAAR